MAEAATGSSLSYSRALSLPQLMTHQPHQQRQRPSRPSRSSAKNRCPQDVQRSSPSLCRQQIPLQRPRVALVLISTVLLLLLYVPLACHAAISCTSDKECELALRPGSKCDFSNPTTTTVVVEEIVGNETDVVDYNYTYVDDTNGTIAKIDDGNKGTTTKTQTVVVVGACTNPFHYGGCLKNHFPNIKNAEFLIVNNDKIVF